MNRYSRSVFFLFSLILITIANSFAQNPEWINYTNGNYVTSIAAQDSSVWVATYGGGLVKINKNTGETSFFNHANSGLPYNAVFSLALDHQGDLWMGNTDGDYSYLVRFDGTQFTSYNLVCVLSIAVDSNDNKWFGCIDLQKFDGTTWTNFSPSGFINIDNLAITSDQHIWGLYRGGNSILDFGYTGDSMTSYNFLNSNIPYGNYSGLAIDSNDTLWFCSTDHVTEETELVSFFNGAMVQVIPFPSSVTGTINQLFIDKNDSKWIASQHGLLEFSNGNWIVYDISNSAISSNAVLAVSTINDNDIWIGTDAGLDRLNNNIWTHHITSNSGLNSRYVLNVKASTLKSIWMDNESSLISFDGEIWSHFNPNNSNGQGPAFNLFDIGDEDNLWLYDISNYGLDQFSIQSNAWSFYNQSNSDIPSNETISALYANNGNGAWMQFVSGVPGLVEYDGTTWKIFNTTNSSIPSDDSRLIGVDEENNVWLAEPYNNAEHENKITKFNGSQFDTYVFGDTSLHFDFGLSHMARDQQGNWWFTSIPGIFKFDGTEFILNPNGFSAYNALNILIDANDVKWMGTYSGLIRIDDSSKYVFDISNSGLGGNHVYAVAKDNSGNLWMGTENGLSEFQEGGIVSVDNGMPAIKKFNLKVFPNPFQQSTTVCIFLEKNADITLEVFNLLGQKVKTILQNQNQSAGKHQYSLTGIGEGIYLMNLTVDGIYATQKLICQK